MQISITTTQICPGKGYLLLEMSMKNQNALTVELRIDAKINRDII